MKLFDDACDLTSRSILDIFSGNLTLQDIFCRDLKFVVDDEVTKSDGSLGTDEAGSYGVEGRWDIITSEVLGCHTHVMESVKETVPRGGSRNNSSGLNRTGINSPVCRLGLDELDTDLVETSTFGPLDPVAYRRLYISYPETP